MVISLLYGSVFKVNDLFTHDRVWWLEYYSFECLENFYPTCLESDLSPHFQIIEAGICLTQRQGRYEAKARFVSFILEVWNRYMMSVYTSANSAVLGIVSCIPLAVVIMTKVYGMHPTFSGRNTRVCTISDLYRSLPTSHGDCRSPLDIKPLLH